MKGQFMIISAVIAGLLILSTASIVAETQSQEFSVDKTGYTVENIKDEAEKIDIGNSRERQEFERLVGFKDYRSDVNYKTGEECFDIELTKPDERLEIECVGTEETGSPSESEKPEADISSNNSNPETDETIELDGSGSEGGNESIISYSWEFNDGNTRTGETVRHNYTDEGEYTVELEVEDDNGNTDTSTLLIDVEDKLDFGETPENCEEINSDQISNLHELQCVKEDSNSDYELVSDIDASSTSDWNEGQGFEPIQDFKGSLDGRGHSIDNLYIDNTSENIGLFRNIESDGYVERIELNGEIAGEGRVGALAGTNEGSINKIGFNGDLEGFNAVGGLVGLNEGGSISKVYTDGSVEGEFEIGGIVGNMDQGEISHSYSSSSVIAGDDFSPQGGLVGEYIQGEFEGSYWDIESTGQDDATAQGTPPEGVEGLSTDDMTGGDSESNMDEFNFDDKWNSGDQGEYPLLEIFD